MTTPPDLSMRLDERDLIVAWLRLRARHLIHGSSVSVKDDLIAVGLSANRLSIASTCLAMANDIERDIHRREMALQKPAKKSAKAKR